MAQHHLAVALARVAQYRPEQPRPPGFSAIAGDGRTKPEIHLHFFTRLAFDAPNPRRLSRLEFGDVARHRWIGAAETVPGDQILIDALGALSEFEHRLDDLLESVAQAARAGATWVVHFAPSGGTEPVITSVVHFDAAGVVPEPVVTSVVHFGPAPAAWHFTVRLRD